jgi:hypothetical protein
MTTQSLAVKKEKARKREWYGKELSWAEDCLTNGYSTHGSSCNYLHLYFLLHTHVRLVDELSGFQYI